jgi:hypothetical protein
MWLEYRQQALWNEIHKGIWQKHQLEKLESRWKGEYRMNFSQFLTLLKMLTPFIQKQDTHFRDAIPADKALAITLHRLAYSGLLKRTGNYLGLSAALVSLCIEFVQCWWNIFMINLFKFLKVKNYKLSWEVLKHSQESLICREQLTGPISV